MLQYDTDGNLKTRLVVNNGFLTTEIVGLKELGLDTEGERRIIENHSQHIITRRLEVVTENNFSNLVKQ